MIEILSASQIESFDPATEWGCKRKWWFERIGGKAHEKDRALTLGDAVHQTLETFLLGGEQGGLHDLVIGAPGALEWLLKLRQRIAHVEIAFGPGVCHPPMKIFLPETLLAGVPVRGRIDWIANSSDGLELGDHKTTSVIAKYAKTPGQVKKSVQMNIYAKWLGERRAFDLLRVTQDFYQTRGAKKFEPVSTTISKLENKSRINEIEATVEEMVKVSQARTPEEVAPNEAVCFKGFGCPHRAYCKRSGDVDMASLMDAFFPTEVPAELAAVLPPDAPASNPPPPLPVVEAGKLKIDDSKNPTGDAVAPQPSAVPSEVVVPGPINPLGEVVPTSSTTVPSGGAATTPKKRGRGRPAGSQNLPKDLGVPKEDAAPVVQIDRVSIRLDVKVGKPGFSSVGASVEMGGLVAEGATLKAAKDAVSQQVRIALVEELARFEKKEEVKAP
jgi:hypothetical protein